MNRRQADLIAGALVGAIVLVGALSVVQLYTSGGAMMDGMGPNPAIHYVGPMLATLVVASLVGGVYIFVRTRTFGTDADPTTRDATPNEPADRTGWTATEDAAGGTVGGNPGRELLHILPEDERRILEPVIESPGLTQIEVRDRSEFSRSKVSQTVTDLEKRGLLYREPQGRTYRVYLAEDFEESI